MAVQVVADPIRVPAHGPHQPLHARPATPRRRTPPASTRSCVPTGPAAPAGTRRPSAGARPDRTGRPPAPQPGPPRPATPARPPHRRPRTRHQIITQGTLSNLASRAEAEPMKLDVGSGPELADLDGRRAPDSSSRTGQRR